MYSDKVIARAYQSPSGDWEVHYSDMPTSTPDYVQEDHFPDFLNVVLFSGHEGVIDVLVSTHTP